MDQDSDERNIDETEIRFKYISIQKMEGVLRVVQRKIQKEKELQMRLDYEQQLLQFTAHEDLVTKPNVFRSSESLIKIKERLTENVSKREATWSPVNRQEAAIPRIGNFTSQSIVEKTELVETKPTAKQILKTKFSGRTKSNCASKNPVSVKRDGALKRNKAVVISKQSFTSRTSQQLSKANSTEIPPTSKSDIFTSLCRDMWRRLEAIEAIEERSRQHIKAQIPKVILQGNFYKAQVRPEMYYESKRNSAIETRSIMKKQPLEVQERGTNYLQLYESNSNSLLITRLSNEIIEDLLKQLSLELSAIPQMFIEAIFESEFRLS